MQRSKWCFGLVTAGAVVAALALGAAPAAAQQAPAKPAAAAPAKPAAATPAKPAAQKQAFRPRDLITPEERAAYRAQIRAARENPAEQQRIRERLMVTLKQRAEQRGGTLVMGSSRPAPAEAAKREARPEARPASPPPRAP